MRFKKLMGGALAATFTVSAIAGGMLSAVAESQSADGTAGEGVNIVAPYAESSDEMGGYLYVHFIDEEETAKKEQVYFSVSPNAKDWYILNNGAPVASITRSNPQGSDGGIRDPYILRKHDNSGYYIIATDLSIYNLANTDGHGGNCWGQSQQHGSDSIIVWETDDLTDLGEPRMVKIAPENGTCTWAPEAIWDDEKEAYMVFWSVLANKSWNNNGTWETGMYWTHHVYRCYTTDFLTFTEPEIYIQSEQKTIDASIIKEGDTYYRFTKIETNTGDGVYNPHYGSKTVFMEKCKSLSGEWEMVSEYKIDDDHWSLTTGFEGPSIFKLNEKDSGGKDQWCLMLDDYGGAGYTPFMTDDITKGEFTKAADISFDSHGRHGSFLPLTKSEYEALCVKWNNGVQPLPPVPEEEREHKKVFSMSFEDNTDVNAGSVTATAYGTITYETGVNGGKAAKFDGSDYIQIDGSALSQLDSFTVSFAAKVIPNKLSWIFYADKDGKGTTDTETYCGIVWNANNGNKLKAERYLNSRSSSPSPEWGIENADGWNHITIVYAKTCTYIYVNGALVQSTETTVKTRSVLGANPTIFIGKAMWGGGEYSDCSLDEFEIYNWGMTADEVSANYRTVMGIGG